jgi:hypothetical protein
MENGLSRDAVGTARPSADDNDTVFLKNVLEVFAVYVGGDRNLDIYERITLVSASDLDLQDSILT